LEVVLICLCENVYDL